MNCELAQTAVHGYFDGELDAMRAAEFEKHLEACAECQASLEQLDELQSRLRADDLYEHASPQLRARLKRQSAEESREGSGLLRLRKFAIPAFAVLSLAAVVAMVLMIPSRSDSERLMAEVIDAHVRSLQPGHLIDVQSTDQHTVKPWFDGKLEFIPPVTDYSAQGFPLGGGRLDVIDAREVAAFV